MARRPTVRWNATAGRWMAWVRFPDGSRRKVERVEKSDAQADLDRLLDLRAPVARSRAQPQPHAVVQRRHRRVVRRRLHERVPDSEVSPCPGEVYFDGDSLRSKPATWRRWMVMGEPSGASPRKAAARAWRSAT